MSIRKAERSKAKLRVGISAPSGAGKTYSALLLASGIAPWEKIIVIDSENNSSEYYSHLGPFSVRELKAPFSPEAYISAIQECEEAGFEVIIIDSATHEWDGKGGVLQLNEKLALSKFKGNTWAAWSEMTPRHQNFLYAMTQSKAHIITTARDKVETVMDEKTKKVTKVGMKEIQREGFEYEFTLFFNLERETHTAMASKDRTNLFEGQDPFIITKETGEMLKTWANSGKEPEVPQTVNEVQITTIRELLGKLKKDEQKMCAFYKIEKLEDLDKTAGGDLIMAMKAELR